jgi:phage-related protein
MTIPVIYTAGEAGSLAIVDQEDNIYYLPENFLIKTIPMSKQYETLKLAFAHGAKDISDHKTKERAIELSGAIYAETDEEYRTIWDEIVQRFNQEDFYLRAGTRQILIKKTLDMPETYPGAFRLRRGDFTIMLMALDPFWYKTTSEVKELEAASSPYQFTFYNGGTVETRPIIRIDNIENNTDFTLTANTDNDRELRIQDPSALAGTYIEINCKEGTVMRGGSNNIIQYFSGLFLRLLHNRDNNFTYEGAEATLKFTYFWAWL